MSASQDVQVSWLGLGNIGRGCATNLSKNGKLSTPLIIYNRTKARANKLAETLSSGQIKVAEQLEDAISGVDIVFSCLADDPALKETFTSILKQDVKGKLFVECSTVLPETTQEIADQVKAKGGLFVASPVFGAPAMADAGKLVFVLAGPPDLVKRVIPYTTDVMGKAYIEVGEDYSKANILKLAGNGVIMSMVEGLAESLTLSEKAGLDTQAFKAFVENVMGPGPWLSYLERMMSGSYHKREEPLFSVDLARKDSGHMLSLAKKHGATMGNVENIYKNFGIVREEQGQKGDMAGVYGANRKLAGLPFKN